MGYEGSKSFIKCMYSYTACVLNVRLLMQICFYFVLKKASCCLLSDNIQADGIKAFNSTY